MPIQPQPWHGEFRPNLGTEGEGVIFASFDLRLGPNNVTALTNGGFVVTWNEFDRFGTNFIRAQLYDALGARVGGEIAVNTRALVGHNPENNEPAQTFDVAAQPGGGFVVAWARQANAGDIVFQRFSSTGAKLGVETDVVGGADAAAGANTGREWDPNIATLANGDFVVTWIEDSAAGTDIHGTTYTAAGMPLLGMTNSNLTFNVPPVPSRVIKDSDVAATPDGGIVITHRLQDDVFFRKFVQASFGGPFFFFETSSAQVSTQPAGVQRDGAITSLSNGGWAVAYTDEVSGMDHNAFLRVYDAAGALVNTIFLGVDPDKVERVASIAGGPDGTFLVTWEEWTKPVGDTLDFDIDVKAALFTNGGFAIGDALQVNTVDTLQNGTPIVTALTDGRYAVAWLRDNIRTFTIPPDGQTFVQILDGRDATIIGNNNANILVGHDTGQSNLNDTILGLGANDRLFGFAGNDTLNGGLGADLMTGGIGNDAYVVDNAGDRAIEGANGGTDRVVSSVAFALAANVENLTLSGAGGISGTGNGLANTITGNGGANRLTGLSGNDSLNGAAGNDLLTGGLGRDSLTGGLGADRFDFNTVAESPRGSARDRVSFVHAQGDKIDLATIDADTDGTAGNQAFRFIGAAAFSGVDGQLRFGGGILQGDTNGDRIADIEIRVIGTLVRGDIIL
ncbi:MAG TPA: calcium-binding protein [Beijerinckiaceae bacterium]|jgi:Ca2+-binding RTX toxin-like protein